MAFKSLVAAEMHRVTCLHSLSEQHSKVGRDQGFGWGSEARGCLFSLENNPRVWLSWHVQGRKQGLDGGIVGLSYTLGSSRWFPSDKSWLDLADKDCVTVCFESFSGACYFCLNE